MMTVRDAVAEGVRRLKSSAESPFLDTVLLLEEATGSTKERLFASYTDQLSQKVERIFDQLLDKRLSGTPISYIRRTKEFYSLLYTVDKRVLAPRPDTEILVEAALGICKSLPGTPRVHDCCTGSGCIAISLKHTLSRLEVSASDLSVDALYVFVENSRNILGSALHCAQSNLLESVHGIYDLITANPPYLTSAQVEILTAKGWPEPLIALDGGHDGLDLYHRLIAESTTHLSESGYILLEADPDQMDTIGKMLLQNAYCNIMIYKDLAGRERVIQARR